jgi:hypothetical protein
MAASMEWPDQPVIAGIRVCKNPSPPVAAIAAEPIRFFPAYRRETLHESVCMKRSA